MAKKKSSVKKTTVKKVSKVKPVKKTAAKKSVKKVVKKATAKKTSTKSSVKKTAVKKSAAKKNAVTAKVKTTKSTPQKKVLTPKTTPNHLVKTAAPVKKLDLSGFVTPLDDRILVQLSGAEKMTAGGLYIPDTVADTSGNLQGYVVSVGRGHMNKKGLVRPMDVKVGDRIVFSEYAGSKIKIQNEDLIILREGDVLGVVSK